MRGRVIAKVYINKSDQSGQDYCNKYASKKRWPAGKVSVRQGCARCATHKLRQAKLNTQHPDKGAGIFLLSFSVCRPPARVIES